MFILLCYYTYRTIILYFFFFFNDTATTEIYTLSLHDALPISAQIPAASNSFRIQFFISNSVNVFFSRTLLAASRKASRTIRSMATPAERCDSSCAVLQQASYFWTRSAELTTFGPQLRTNSIVPASTMDT